MEVVVGKKDIYPMFEQSWALSNYMEGGFLTFLTKSAGFGINYPLLQISVPFEHVVSSKELNKPS